MKEKLFAVGVALFLGLPYFFLLGGCTVTVRVIHEPAPLPLPPVPQLTGPAQPWPGGILDRADGGQ